MKVLYGFLKVTFQVTLRVFFRRVYINNEENLPADGPVILGVNHPNSFLDAIVMGTICPRPLYFLARSDVFNTPFKKWLLWQMHMLPVYRIEEGKENLHRNDETFNIGKKLFSKNKVMLIFSEGVCVQEKRLRKLRKGTARLAFDAEVAADFSLGLKVVPVTLNYTYPKRFREEVIVTYGKPILMQDFRNAYENNPATAINQFNAELYRRLEENTIVIRDRNSEAFAETLLMVGRSEWNDKKAGWLKYNKLLRLRNEQLLADKVNRWEGGKEEMLADMKATASDYEKNLKEWGLNDRAVKNEGKLKTWKLLLFFLLSPLAILGYLVNFLPLLLSKNISRAAVKTDEFYASVLVGSSYLLYVIYYVICIVLGSTLLNPLLYAVPLFGIVSLFWLDRAKIIFPALRYRRLSEDRKERIRLLRSKVLAMLSYSSELDPVH